MLCDLRHWQYLTQPNQIDAPVVLMIVDKVKALSIKTSFYNFYLNRSYMLLAVYSK